MNPEIFEALVLSHMNREIKVPLMTILDATSVLHTPELSSDKQRALQSIREASGTLMFRINNILDMYALGKGEIAFNNASFNVEKFLLMLEGVISLQASATKTEFLLSIDERVPTFIKGDALRLGQILLNLMDRALKTVDGGGIVLYVRMLELRGETMILQFGASDTGDTAPEVPYTTFEDASSAHEYMINNFGESGTELAITYELVNRMGGSISMRAMKSRGTTFYVTLPFQRITDDARNCTVTSNVDRDNAAPLRSLSILIVDDNDTNRMLLERVLRKRGHVVVQAVDGRDAIEHFKLQNYDLILMDYHMPYLNGVETSRVLRELEKERGTYTPIVMVSTIAPEDIEEEMDGVIDNFIPKPIILRDLWKIVDKLCAQ